MIKKVLCALVFILPLMTFSQSDNPWQLGVNAAPFYFGRYNAEAIRELDKQNFPNGFLFGLTVEKNWNKNWGVNAGLEYSFQNRKDIQFFAVATGSTVSSDFEYLKLPLTLQYSKELGFSRNLFLVLNQGAQVSMLIDYYTILEDHLQVVIYDSGERHLYGKETGLVNRWPNEAYSEFLIGIVGSVGVKKYFSSNFSYSAYLRYEIDITDADKELLLSSTNHTHNYRIGLVFGVQYHLY